MFVRQQVSAVLVGVLAMAVAGGIGSAVAPWLEPPGPNQRELGVLLAGAGAYVGGALYLLTRYRDLSAHLVIRLALSVAGMVVVPVLCAIDGSASARTGYYVLAVYVAIASVALLVAGMDNLLWSIRQASGSGSVKS